MLSSLFLVIASFCILFTKCTSTFVDNSCNKDVAKSNILNLVSLYQQGKIVELASPWEDDVILQAPGTGGNPIVGKSAALSFFQAAYAGGTEFQLNGNDIHVDCLPGNRYVQSLKLFYKFPGGVFTPTSAFIIGISHSPNNYTVALTAFGVN